MNAVCNFGNVCLIASLQEKQAKMFGPQNTNNCVYFGCPFELIEYKLAKSLGDFTRDTTLMLF